MPKKIANVGGQLILHSTDNTSKLSASYKRALLTADEILIVSAYLTHWDDKIKLNDNCKRFRMIVGKDFGITRKEACRSVLRWLPKSQRVNFRVADQISGFHPKAVFWRDKSGKAFALIGSSNLSVAAFESNFEANVEIEISLNDYEQAKYWVDSILNLSVPISEDWLAKYQESSPKNATGKKKKSGDGPEVFSMKLPRPNGITGVITKRRNALIQHHKNRNQLIALFRQCADGEIDSIQFYRSLPNFWGWDAGGRLQGNGWERTGSVSNFQELSRSFLKILDADDNERDDIVKEEIDRLADISVPTRRAFLSEMLCLSFPELYPLLNAPVQAFLVDKKFRGAAGLSEGGKYIDLSQKLRLSLAQNRNHPADNLAELDSVIWLAYRK